MFVTVTAIAETADDARVGVWRSAPRLVRVSFAYVLSVVLFAVIQWGSGGITIDAAVVHGFVFAGCLGVLDGALTWIRWSARRGR